MWVPFLAVIVVLFFVGNIASKQVKQQSGAKESIAVFDADNSQLSRNTLEAVGQIADVKFVSSGDSDEFVKQMKEIGLSVGIVIPEGFA